MAAVDIEPSINESNDGQNVQVKVDREDVIRRLSWRVKRSVTFLITYIVVILANLFVLIWEITGTAVYTVSITLEALINIIFLIEVLVEIITQENYFRKCWNVADFTICLLCIISFIVFCIYYSVSGDSSSSLYYSYSDTAVESLADNDDDDDINDQDTGSVSLDINDLDMILLLIRYVFQSIRLCRFMATAAKRKKTQGLEEDIEFPDTNAEDYPITKGSNEYVTADKGNYETITTV